MSFLTGWQHSSSAHTPYHKAPCDSDRWALCERDADEVSRPPRVFDNPAHRHYRKERDWSKLTCRHSGRKALNFAENRELP
ncbi:MAG: hypothetical protein KatS3mg113_0534 [Planctomycetaceae bacterium]|nr:MAG: hypothetical protein KatS3mg113_0534 [Planctomycetaceae bacterium]